MAEEFESVVEVFRKFGEDTVSIIQKSIDSKKISASSVMRQSLNYHVVTSPDITKFTLDFGKATYAKWIDEGRGPTKKAGSGPDAVQKNLLGINGWIAHKGIQLPTQYTSRWTLKDGTKKSKLVDYKASKTLSARDKSAQSLAYLIARKIHTKGTKATHFYSEVVTPQIFDELKINLAKAAKKDITLQIRNFVKVSEGFKGKMT